METLLGYMCRGQNCPDFVTIPMSPESSAVLFCNVCNFFVFNYHYMCLDMFCCSVARNNSKAPLRSPLSSSSNDNATVTSDYDNANAVSSTTSGNLIYADIQQVDEQIRKQSKPDVVANADPVFYADVSSIRMSS